MTDIPPHPDDWRPGSIVLERDVDGSLSGILVLDGARHWVVGWQRGETDGLAVVFRCQHVRTEEGEAEMVRLTRTLSSG